jgi:hypothetical protein
MKMRIRIQDGHWVEGDDIVHLYRTIAHILGAVYGENEQGDWVQVGETVEPFRAWALEHLEGLRCVDPQAEVHLYKALAAQQNDVKMFVEEARARETTPAALMGLVLQKYTETQQLMSAVEAVVVKARQIIYEAKDVETIIQALIEVQQARQPRRIDQSGSVNELAGGV